MASSAHSNTDGFFLWMKGSGSASFPLRIFDKIDGYWWIGLTLSTCWFHTDDFISQIAAPVSILIIIPFLFLWSRVYIILQSLDDLFFCWRYRLFWSIPHLKQMTEQIAKWWIQTMYILYWLFNRIERIGYIKLALTTKPHFSTVIIKVYNQSN